MTDTWVEKRRYIRHPSDIPIEVNTGTGAGDEHSLRNVSFGGICFCSCRSLEPGSIIHIRITLIHPVFESRGRVAWCKDNGDGSWDAGIEFVDTQDAFRARMVEQICHIEQYRKEVREKEGRSLTGKEAALEWIAKYAKTFY